MIKGVTNSAVITPVDILITGEPNLIPPAKGDAGYDVISPITVTIPAGSSVNINIGVKIITPEGWVGLVRGRSSMMRKKLFVNHGTLDSSYRGFLELEIHNMRTHNHEIKEGNKIAQIVFVPHLSVPVVYVSEEQFALHTTERGTGGFGSTGE